MSYPQSVPYVVVKEQTQYKQLFQDFAKQVTESFIWDSRRVVQRHVLAFVSLIPRGLADEQFTNDLDTLFQSFNEKLKVQWERYNIQIKGAKCPDVLPRPSGVLPLDSPDGIDLRNVFHIARDLLYRRNLLLKKEVSDEI